MISPFTSKEASNSLSEIASTLVYSFTVSQVFLVALLFASPT